MTFNKILTMIHDACTKTFYSGDRGHEDTVILCATQIYIAQMDKNGVK